MARRPSNPRGRGKEPEAIDPSAILSQLQEGLSLQAKRPNVFSYKPHDKQFKFHSSVAKKRLYIGGNRSGKTVGGTVETIYWLKGDSPYRKVPPAPISMRAVAVDFNYGVDVIMLPLLQQWLPPSLLIKGSWEQSYDREHRILTLSNKSTLEFRSYDQDLEKFAGTSRHAIWFDEEPPKSIYNECMARLVDTDGDAWITMTPLDGLTWVHDDLYIPGLGDDPSIDVIEIDMHENPHLKPEAIKAFLDSLDEDERRARESGHFITVGGKVFKNFDPNVHVIDPVLPPKEWQWYVSIDHGFNNPTAMIWHAVSPAGKIITFDEHYASEMTVKEHAEIFHQKCKEHGKYPYLVVGDPAMAQRSGINGMSIIQEYSICGVNIATQISSVSVGINRMIQYLRTPNPYWQITKNCINLITEMKKLRWEAYSSKKLQFQNNKQEKIHKKDDHACDSTRYLFTFMPDLSPSSPVVTNSQDRNILGAVRGSSPVMNVDPFSRPVVAKDWSELVPKTPQWDIVEGLDYVY